MNIAIVNPGEDIEVFPKLRIEGLVSKAFLVAGHAKEFVGEVAYDWTFDIELRILIDNALLACGNVELRQVHGVRAVRTGKIEEGIIRAEAVDRSLFVVVVSGNGLERRGLVGTDANLGLRGLEEGGEARTFPWVSVYQESTSPGFCAAIIAWPVAISIRYASK